jgi:hypothetical protein
MKKISQRELLQEDFADMVRAAGRVAADIYAPVIKPIKDALNAWESPEKALREYVKRTPNIRITKIISTKPVKAGSSGGRIGISLPTAGLTKGRYGTNIYQIQFEAEIYNPVTGLFEQAYTPSQGGILMPSFTKTTTPSSSTPPASAAGSTSPAKRSPKVYRADIERVNGKYTVQGIYDSKGEPVALNSRSRTPKSNYEDILSRMFNGSDSDYTLRFIGMVPVAGRRLRNTAKFKAAYNRRGSPRRGDPEGEYTAIFDSNGYLRSVKDSSNSNVVWDITR